MVAKRDKPANNLPYRKAGAYVRYLGIKPASCWAIGASLDWKMIGRYRIPLKDRASLDIVRFEGSQAPPYSNRKVQSEIDIDIEKTIADAVAALRLRLNAWRDHQDKRSKDSGRGCKYSLAVSEFSNADCKWQWMKSPHEMTLDKQADWNHFITNAIVTPTVDNEQRLTETNYADAGRVATKVARSPSSCRRSCVPSCPLARIRRRDWSKVRGTAFYCWDVKRVS